MPAQSTLPARWNQQTLDAIILTATPPPMAARILAHVHTAMYDAWAAYHDTAISTCTAGFHRRPAAERTKENRWKAVSFATFQILKAYFVPALGADKKAIFDEAMRNLGFDPADVSEDTTTPTGIGNFTAKAVLDRARGDGANTWQTLKTGKPYADYTNYQPEIGPDDAPGPQNRSRWQPLKIKKADGTTSVQSFLVPHWGLAQPFALRNGAEFRPIAAPEANMPRFKTQADAVLAFSADLTDERKAIAEYWSDGPKSVTPPGHWCVLAQEVSRRDGHGMGKDIKMFFALANALMDAGIACWECKRHYDYVRPVTAIRNLYKGQKIRAWGGPNQNTDEIMGENWHPFQPLDFVTPPFAEYPSGHSTFSRAGAEILRRFTGSDRFDHGVDILPGSSKIEPGTSPAYLVRLHWNTFSQAADQAGISRRFGGIHFEDGDLRGRELGQKVAEKVWAKCQRLWSGME